MRRVNFKDLPADPEGDARRFAEIVASRQGPGLFTDTRRFAGVAAGDPFKDIHPQYRQVYMAKAKAAGVNPDGKKYIGQLASEPGDPRAWVDSSTDIRQRCEEKGWGCDGIVNVSAPEIQVDDLSGPYKVSDKIVEERFAEAIAENPEIAPTPREQTELKEQLRERLSGTTD